MPYFTIHATGSRGNMPDLGNRPYRLRSRFRIGAYPSRDLLDKAKVAAAETFVRDMRKQGFEFIGESSRIPAHARGFRMTGPYSVVEPITIRQPRELSSEAMLQRLNQGWKPPADDGGTTAGIMTPIAESESWEYELSGVFLHKTILTDVPDPHEVKE